MQLFHWVDVLFDVQFKIQIVFIFVKLLWCLVLHQTIICSEKNSRDYTSFGHRKSKKLKESTNQMNSENSRELFRELDMVSKTIRLCKHFVFYAFFMVLIFSWKNSLINHVKKSSRIIETSVRFLNDFLWTRWVIVLFSTTVFSLFTILSL